MKLYHPEIKEEKQYKTPESRRKPIVCNICEKSILCGNILQHVEWNHPIEFAKGKIDFAEQKVLRESSRPSE